MENLASCYFCGAALDARLQRYPIVPEAFRDDGDVTTATLCPACHQKLETVFDAVVAAADSHPEPATTAAHAFGGGDESGALSPDSRGDDAGASTGTEDEDVPPEDAQPDTLEEEAHDGASGTDSLEAATADVEHSAGDGTDTGTEPPAEPGGTGADDEGGVSDEDEALRAAMQADVPEVFQSGGDAGTDEEGSDDVAPDAPDSTDATVDTGGDELAAEGVDEPAEEIDSDTPDDGDDETDALRAAMQADVPEAFQSGGDAADAARAGDADTDEVPPTETDASAEPTGDGTAGSASGTARTTVSALEYNKVMRLLQNRALPADREEIEVAAANAYDLSRAECGAVIDLAVDRGLVDEDGDRLVRPD